MSVLAQFSDLPLCVITDRMLVSAAASPALSTALPFVELLTNTDAFFVRQSDGSAPHIGSVDLRLIANPTTGVVSVGLPPMSLCVPMAILWTFQFPDGSTLSGGVTDDMVAHSPLTFLQLRSTYGWVFNSPVLAADPTDAAQVALVVAIAQSLIIFADPTTPGPLFMGGRPLLFR